MNQTLTWENLYDIKKITNIMQYNNEFKKISYKNTRNNS